VTLPPDMSRFTGYLLRRAFVKATGVAQECVSDDSTLREVGFLSVLNEHGPISQRALADLTHVSPTLVVKFIDMLENKQWVVRERSPRDRRFYMLSLTREGQKALASFNDDLDAGEATLTADLSADEVLRLRAHLKVLLAGDPVLEVESLADRTGYLISHAHHRLRSYAEGALSVHDLHPRDFGLLSIVARDEPCAQNHIAANLGVTPPAVLGFVEELETRGLVTRDRSRADRRVYEIRLTDRGRQTLAKAKRAAGEIQKEIAEALGPEADADLRALLAKLIGR
jgi:DNA-binding MarR family transcriptional regulator